VRRAASARTPFIAERSIISPPSHRQNPGTLWPPPRIETSIPASRARRMQWSTSAAPVARTITAGLRSIIPLWILRTSS
jgi:hypothetical protein